MKPGRIAADITLLVAFLFFPGKAVRFVAAFILIAEGASFAYSKILQDGLTAARIVREMRVARHDRLELLVTFENGSFLPAPSCYVCDTPGPLSVSADDGRWLLALGAKSRTTLRYTVIGNERGEYSVGPLRVAASDPLGLFPFEKTIEDRCTILVRPARVNCALSLDSGIPQGTVTVRDPRFEDVTLYRSVRDYASGDELKRINWKSSARFGKLFTNEYQDTLSCPVFVFLDLAAENYPIHLRYTLVESLVETAAAIVERASFLRQQCGFASTGILPGDQVRADAEHVTGDAPQDNASFKADAPGQKGAPDPNGALIPQGVSAGPFVRVGAGQDRCILDILAKIACAEGKTGDGGLLSRARSLAPTGCRFFYVGPKPPEGGGGRFSAFRRLSEYVHEAF